MGFWRCGESEEAFSFVGKCLAVPGCDREINQSCVPRLGERLLIVQLPGLLAMNYPGYTAIRLTESVGNSVGKRARLIDRGIIPSLLRVMLPRVSQDPGRSKQRYSIQL